MRVLPVLLVAGCSHTPASECDPTARVMHADFELAEIEYVAGLRLDAEMAERNLRDTARCLEADYPEVFSRKLAEAYRPELHLYAKSNRKVSPRRARLESGSEDGTLTTYYARIHMLASACYDERGRTMVGEPYDDSYAWKKLAHEYSAIGLDLVLRAKRSGWKLYDAPEWFYQGMPEYLAVRCSSAHARTVTWKKYLGYAKKRNRLNNPHWGGLIRVAYLYDQHDRVAIQRLLQSEEDFDAAFEAHLGVTVATLDPKVEAWLESQ